MTLQTIKPIVAPFGFIGMSNLDHGSSLLDAAGEKVGMIFMVPKTGTISRVGFRTTTVTTAQTLRVSLQTVSATDGFPTGTLYGGSAAGTQAAPAANSFYTVTLGTAASATKGDIVAVVVEFDSTAGNLYIGSYLFSSMSGGSGNMAPYVKEFTTVWGNPADGSGSPIFSLEYSDGSYEYTAGCYPITSNSFVTFNSGSTPDERALRFSFPFSCRVTGFWFYGILSGDTDFVLYQGTTAIQTKSVDFNQTFNNGVQGQHRFFFNSEQVISINTVYYLSAKPTTVTSIQTGEIAVPSAAAMDMFELGQKAYLATRTNAGAWTETTTARPLMGLIIDQLDDGASGAIIPQAYNTVIVAPFKSIGY